MHLNEKKCKKLVIDSQKCQRNWDTTRVIPQEHIELFKVAATQCPSKQNYAFYNLKFVTDRNVIEKLHDNTNPENKFGFGMPDGKFYTCPQSLANLVIVFGYSIPWAKQTDKDKYGHKNYPFKRDADISIGIALGYLFYIANSLGYKTGGCNFKEMNESRLALNESKDYTPVTMLGIGYPDESKNLREHHTVPEFTFPHKEKEHIEIEFI